MTFEEAVERIELELFDSAYPDDEQMRHALAVDIAKALSPLNAPPHENDPAEAGS